MVIRRYKHSRKTSCGQEDNGYAGDTRFTIDIHFHLVHIYCGMCRQKLSVGDSAFLKIVMLCTGHITASKVRENNTLLP